MYENEDDCDTIIGYRKGYVRCAVESGVPIMPVYYFGNGQLLHFGPKFLQGISRKIQASLGIPYNDYLLPFPRQIPIMHVSGKPIPVEKVFFLNINRDYQLIQIMKKLLIKYMKE